MPLLQGLTYPKNWPLLYIDSKGKKRRALVLDIHILDGTPYYTIRILKKPDQEKQTINERLVSYIDSYDHDEIRKTFDKWTYERDKGGATSNPFQTEDETLRREKKDILQIK